MTFLSASVPESCTIATSNTPGLVELPVGKVMMLLKVITSGAMEFTIEIGGTAVTSSDVGMVTAIPSPGKDVVSVTTVTSPDVDSLIGVTAVHSSFDTIIPFSGRSRNRERIDQSVNLFINIYQ